ncbi:hypothetical protein ACFSSA_03170 [Luteolibacter algae]|uniref:Lipoprotein n=1 Tax=Luteolibacter algae TaxID=454151 RepID=A0ABW5D4K1_9BACT
MKSKFLFSLPVLGCLALASCYPLPDNPNGPRGPRTPQQNDASVTSGNQQKIQEQREAMKKRDEEKKETASNQIKETEKEVTPTKPTEKKSGDYAFANPVPGKEGFVFSPYNNKLVDVRDIPSGTLVQDPTYPAAEKKYFRVP